MINSKNVSNYLQNDNWWICQELFFDVFSTHPLCISMKTKKVNCENCGNEFEKLLKEYKRSEKLKRKHFCNRSCAMVYVNNHRPENYWKEQYKHQKKKFDIKSQAGLGNPRDEFSPFRFFINKCKCRNKETSVEVNLTLKYLKKIWDKQMGICPYTGIKMILPDTTNLYQTIHSLKKASIDRIDSSKGYIEDNVEFVCMAINFAKNNYKREDMKSFIKEIVASQNTLSITQGQPT